MAETSSNLNLVDVAEVLRRRWKSIAVFVSCVVVITALLLLFVLPKKYKAEAVVIAGNPMLADKARMFNSNIESLHSNFGSGDDLDRIYGIAKLDTVYKTLVSDFNLINYYNVKGDSDLLKQKRAVAELREDVSVQKNELNQLRIIVWSKSNQQSARIANRMVELIENMLSKIWTNSYKQSLQTLSGSIIKLENNYRQLKDSASAFAMVRKEGLMGEMQQYQKAADEFELVIANPTPALLVLEKAYPSPNATKPNKILVMISAILLSLLFGVIAALIADKKQTLD